jgi:hypothetical protein
MDRRKVAMAAGAAAALVSSPMAAAAAPAQALALPPAASYADLLQPIPNAVERLRLADLQDEAAAPQLIQVAHHHHHHHHNRHWYLTHGYAWIGGVWVLHPHHHHHHHHHHTA